MATFLTLRLPNVIRSPWSGVAAPLKSPLESWRCRWSRGYLKTTRHMRGPARRLPKEHASGNTEFVPKALTHSVVSTVFLTWFIRDIPKILRSMRERRFGSLQSHTKVTPGLSPEVRGFSSLATTQSARQG